jgi:hypothetical protein
VGKTEQNRGDRKRGLGNSLMRALAVRFNFLESCEPRLPDGSQTLLGRLKVMLARRLYTGH